MKDLRYARGAANGQAAQLLAAPSTGTPCSLITMASDFPLSLSHGANLNIIIRPELRFAVTYSRRIFARFLVADTVAILVPSLPYPFGVLLCCQHKAFAAIWK